MEGCGGVAMAGFDRIRLRWMAWSLDCLLGRILLIYQLFGTGDFLVKCKTMNASYGDPGFFRIQNSTVHNSLDFAVAQNFHGVSYVDMQCMWELRNHLPTVAVAVNNLQTLRACEQNV